jgi:uncharacterized protein YegJ (DUF2314 family)
VSRIVSSVDYGMKHLVALVMAILVVAVGCRKSDDPVVKLKAEDPEMNAAISTAQASITNFMAVFRNPHTNQQYFLIKGKFTAGDVVEHIWVADLRYDSGVFHGVIANEPESIPGLRFKQPVEVQLAQISDWMFVQGGKLVGGYTSRVLRKRMSAQQRRELDAHIPYRYE